VEKGGPSLVARRRARSSDDLDDDSSDNAVFAIKNAGHGARPKRPPVSEQQRRFNVDPNQPSEIMEFTVELYIHCLPAEPVSRPVIRPHAAVFKSGHFSGLERFQSFPDLLNFAPDQVDIFGTKFGAVSITPDTRRHPFCRGVRGEIRKLREKPFQGLCPKCGATGPKRESHQEALRVWNGRKS
jgi:hypothetical protein